MTAISAQPAGSRRAFSAGTTLLEALMAMLVISMVAGGILTAFAFSRRLIWRTNCELAATNLSMDIADRFREQLLTPAGVYVDQNMPAGRRPPGTTGDRADLNFPANFSRFQDRTRGTPDWAGHADGRILVVEDLVDLDGDGQTGIDFGGGRILRRIRVKTRWTSP